MNEWAAKYIGLPHEIAGRGPKGFDCWGLIREVYQREFNIELPPFPGIAVARVLHLTETIAEEIKEHWIETPPFEGCGVGMGRVDLIHHVGLYHEGKILHCWPKAGVILESIRGLRLKGFRSILFYQHHLWPHTS